MDPKHRPNNHLPVKADADVSVGKPDKNLGTLAARSIIMRVIPAVCHLKARHKPNDPSWLPATQTS